MSNETAIRPQVHAPGNDTKEPGKKMVITPEYREILRNRRKEASNPRRTVKLMDEGDAGINNMLAAGVGKGHVKSNVGHIVMVRAC